MASSLITSWQIDGETVADFIFLGSQTEDGDCSHEIKRRLLLGRKVMTNLDSILKSRDSTSPTKVRLVKAMVFPVVMYGCESWMVKKAECQRIDAFELWCWRRLLRAPWTARRSNQPILKEISPGWVFTGRTDVEAETPILWSPDAKSWLIWKDPDAGKNLQQEEKGTTEEKMVEWHHRLNGHGFAWTPGVGDGQRGLACCGSWGHKELDTTERLNWTELNTKSCLTLCDFMDCSPPGSSVHGISKARILEWVAMSFSRGSSWPRDRTRVFSTGRWIVYLWATREALTWIAPK